MQEIIKSYIENFCINCEFKESCKKTEYIVLFEDKREKETTARCERRKGDKI